MWEFYEDDLAYIHDVGFGFFALQAAGELLDYFRQCGLTDGLVVDLGCGSGLWARELVRAGYDVLGADISPAMLKLARQKAPGARFQKASYLDVKLPACDVVTSLGECLNYQFDKRNGNRQLFKLFGRIFDALPSGGLFVFDVAEPGRVRGVQHRHWKTDDWALLLEAEEESGKNRLTRRMTTFRKVGKQYRRREQIHVLQLYDRKELAAELRRIGFRVRIVRGYGRFRFPAGLVGFLARKP